MLETLNKEDCNWWNRVQHVEEDNWKWKIVNYTAYDGVCLRYSCNLSETLGVLCQHALYV